MERQMEEQKKKSRREEKQIIVFRFFLSLFNGSHHLIFMFAGDETTRRTKREESGIESWIKLDSWSGTCKAQHFNISSCSSYLLSISLEYITLHYCLLSIFLCDRRG